MNKELIVYLLQQDIHELEMLTQGFEKMDNFPDSILKLASRKAENISLNLSKLGELGELEYGTFDYEVTTEKEEEKHSFLSGEKNGVLPIDNVELDVEVKKNVSLISENEELESKTLEKNDMDDISNQDEFEDKDDFLEKGEELTLNTQEDRTPADSNDERELPSEEKESIQDEQVTLATMLSEKRGEQKNKTLEESLNNQPIKDIRNALSIGDRFRFQRELFNNNGEVMNKTISYLNNLANYDEAEKFLQRKFNWEEDNPDAEDFLKIVRRRY